MTVALLQKRRAVIIADLACKVEAEDWHGVADAAMDLREIDAQLKVIENPVAFGVLSLYTTRQSA